jgi:hypothetical protein
MAMVAAEETYAANQAHKLNNNIRMRAWNNKTSHVPVLTMKKVVCLR